MEVYKLNNQKEFEGETITELLLDFDALSVVSLERAERQARAMLSKREGMAMPEFSKKYLSCVAAAAANVKIDLIRSLSAADYTQVCTLTQNFLLGGGSDLDLDLEVEAPTTTAMQNSMTMKSMSVVESQTDLTD